MVKVDGVVFNSGVPTEPDVRKLMEAFPDLHDGDKVSYKQAARLIGIDNYRTSMRFRTVTTAWRNRMFKQHNLLLVADPNEGWHVAEPYERVQYSGSKFRSGMRFTRRAGNLAARTDVTELDPEQQRARDHIVSVAGSVAAVAATAAKRLRYPDPVLKLEK